MPNQSILTDVYQRLGFSKILCLSQLFFPVLEMMCSSTGWFPLALRLYLQLYDVGRKILGKREHRILVSLWVLLSIHIRMTRTGLSPWRKAHALPRAAEATLYWTSMPGAFLGSSVDRRMPCRQVDQSLQHGCFFSVLLRLNPHMFLPSSWPMAPQLHGAHQQNLTFRQSRAQLSSIVIAGSHTWALSPSPSWDSTKQALCCKQRSRGAGKRGACPAFSPPSLQFVPPNLKVNSSQPHLPTCSCWSDG